MKRQSFLGKFYWIKNIEKSLKHENKIKENTHEVTILSGQTLWNKTSKKY